MAENKNTGSDRDRSARADWMPDSLSPRTVREVLDDPGHEQFPVLAARLLESTEDLDEVTRYLDRDILARHFRRIRISMGRTGEARVRRHYWERRLDEGIVDSGEVSREGEQTSLLSGATDRSSESESGPSSAVQVGRTIRRLRERQGLTQAELGERLNVTRQAISKVEQGRENVTVERLQRIMRALNYRLRFNLEALPES